VKNAIKHKRNSRKEKGKNNQKGKNELGWLNTLPGCVHHAVTDDQVGIQKLPSWL
jgi:hypothetical protein